MTEASFQQARKIMQKANHLRGLITVAKGDVAKWSNIEHSHRNNMKPTQAEGAKKMLDKALVKLDKIRKEFAELKFPEDNAAPQLADRRPCPICGHPLAPGEVCPECELPGMEEKKHKPYKADRK